MYPVIFKAGFVSRS